MIGLTPNSIKGLLLILMKKKSGDPVPSFAELNIQKLSSSLKTPFLRESPEFENTEYILRTAAHFFCIMVESHCAPNANKRLAVVALFTVLRFNGYVLRTSDVRMYAATMAVTWLSKYGLFDEAIEEVYAFLEEAAELEIRHKVSKEERAVAEAEFCDFMQSKT